MYIVTFLRIVVLDTTKVQIFKQITTVKAVRPMSVQLFQIPQRYRFSSKSQPGHRDSMLSRCCFRYHKGTDFQANHNELSKVLTSILVVLDTTKVQIFKQITTVQCSVSVTLCCFRYHKGTDFQANHNNGDGDWKDTLVVLDTTKVQIFKQITTYKKRKYLSNLLFQIPQRYRFSSKSQHKKCTVSIC